MEVLPGGEGMRLDSRECNGNLVRFSGYVGGALASWLVRSSPDRAMRVQALAGDTVVCCVLGQDTLLSQCLSPPRSVNGYR